MASQSKAKLEQRLGECMIRDRFALRKLAGDSKASKQFEKRLARSRALASSRRSLAPKIQYPETLPVVARLDDLKAAIAQSCHRPKPPSPKAAIAQSCLA